MNNLREQIEDHIAKLLEISQTWPDDSDLRNAQSRHSGDHILALIAEAMLSDAAVEAGEDSMYITVKSEPGAYPLIYIEDMPDFRTGLQAALDTAFGPASDQHGAERSE